MEVRFFTKYQGVNESPMYALITLDTQPATRFKYYLKEKISPNNWNQKEQKAKPAKNYADFNNLLETRANQIKSVYRNYVNLHHTEPQPDELKLLIDAVIRPDVKRQPEQPKDLVLPFYLQFIETCKKGARLNAKGLPVSNATIISYTTTYNILTEYENRQKKPFRFADIDLDWYNGFLAYLTTEKRQSVNYIGKHIKNLKTVLNDATERGLNENLYFKRKSFKKPTELTTSIYLNDAELKVLQQTNLSHHPRLDRVRDLFLIGCHTGLRHSDWSKVTPEQIEDGFITITPNKTKDAVVIPVHDTVLQIIEKYNGKLPKVPSNQKTNEYLKDIGKMLENLKKTETKRITKGGLLQSSNMEKWELLTTHVARRSFATNQYLAGIPTITIMAITGHKTEREFLRYIRATSKEHAQVMKLQWENNRKQTKVIAL